MAVLMGATNGSKGKKLISLEQINTMRYDAKRVKDKNRLVATIIRQGLNDPIVVIPASMSNKQKPAGNIYLFGKRGVDYRLFKTAKSAQDFIERLRK